MKKSRNKTAIVTGASRGIGAAIARKLASMGYDLVLTCSESTGELGLLAKEIKDLYNIKCDTIKADAGDPTEVAGIFESPVLEDGLDVLVNNAGVSYVGLLHEMKTEDWRRVMSVNLDSLFYTCRGAITLMLREHSGSIVNISSVWGNAGASTEVAYSASKGGVNAFTKGLAKELAPSGIAVNAVSCGLIDTKMNSCFSEEELRAVVGEIPADRMGSAQEVAEVVARIIDSPAYMTGQIIGIDGGWI
ncbi:MAG: SDR family NAD(P)-dependent oxidoreductase [Lachnospiraceae bacterium]|nr:SDR family NAD(P)-dependent oxidoreductase [Lachnospiraceae bacterium]